MITREQALKLGFGDRIHYVGLNSRGTTYHKCVITTGPRGGVTSSIVECRVNGNVQTWKTRPAEFRVPIKYGMREYGSITHGNNQYWHLAPDCVPERIDQRQGTLPGIGKQA